MKKIKHRKNRQQKIQPTKTKKSHTKKHTHANKTKTKGTRKEDKLIKTLKQQNQKTIAKK